MHKVYFYKDKNGHEPVFDYMADLKKNTDKDSRIKLNKINDYIEMLCRYGTQAGEPYIKHLDGDIWELRPLRDRILFCCLDKRRLCPSSPIYEKNAKNTGKRN